MTLRETAEQTRFREEEITAGTREIYRSALRRFASRGGANFTILNATDLEALFLPYDERFFQGGLRRYFGAAPLGFRVSSRMTRAGGKTIRRRRPLRSGTLHDEYEIVISTTLLLQTFHDVDRSITVSGLECHDRLEALQRIFEHEMIHVLELILWDRSSCTAARFRSLAWRLFGHKAHTHDLITPQERALKRFGIRPGDRVAFPVRGEHIEGIVNRINRRATVLVEDRKGRRYSNGKRYARFYVPLSMLQMIGH